MKNILVTLLILFSPTVFSLECEQGKSILTAYDNEQFHTVKKVVDSAEISQEKCLELLNSMMSEPLPFSFLDKGLRKDIALTVLFDFDSSILSDNSKASLTRFYKSEAGNSITIFGFTDPVGTNEYNLSLGMRRALAIESYLLSLGWERTSITTVSRGEEDLVSKDYYYLNRRGVIVW